MGPPYPYCFGYLQACFRKGGSPLAHCLLRCPCAHHGNGKNPEQLAGKQLLYGHSLSVLIQGTHRHKAEIYRIQQRHQRPDKAKDSPVMYTGQARKTAWKSGLPPHGPSSRRNAAAHGRRFLVKGAGLHDRADQYLYQAAADGVKENGYQHAHVRVRHQIRQDS